MPISSDAPSCPPLKNRVCARKLLQRPFPAGILAQVSLQEIGKRDPWNPFTGTLDVRTEDWRGRVRPSRSRWIEGPGAPGERSGNAHLLRVPGAWRQLQRDAFRG